MKRNQMIKLMEYPLTDAGNAARLHEIFGKKWVYNIRQKMGVYAQIQEMDAVGRPLPADGEGRNTLPCGGGSI